MTGRFRKGDRVQVHPATDRWMRGDRYGTVVLVGRTKYTVTLDRSGQTLFFRERDLMEVDR